MVDDDTCFTGGAAGSDYRWGLRAHQAGHKVVAYSFEGHSFRGIPETRIVLSEAQLLEALPHVKAVSARLNKNAPHDSNRYIRNLMCRNWWVVKDASALYAIGKLENGVVEGGTGWGVEMFMRQAFESVGSNIIDVNVFLFNTQYNTWYTFTAGMWVPIPIVPRPQGQWAGIGTRALSISAGRAIDRLTSPKI